MTTDEGIVYDRSLLGVETDIGTFELTREMLLGFAKSTGETNPRYVGDENGEGDIFATSTFCNVFVSGVSRPDIKLEFGEISFFAGQSIECKAEIRPGDVLSASTKLDNVYAKTGRSGKMVFAVWETHFKNQDDTTVALVTESFVRRNKSR